MRGKGRRLSFVEVFSCACLQFDPLRKQVSPAVPPLNIFTGKSSLVQDMVTSGCLSHMVANTGKSGAHWLSLIGCLSGSHSFAPSHFLARAQTVNFMVKAETSK